jgi:ubiquinone/menaquinone biosynthesis C-methylase UbiE
MIPVVASLQERGKKMKDFDPSGIDFNNPSALFRFEDRLKSLIGGPLYYAPYFRSCGGFEGDEDVLDFGCGGGGGVSTRSIAAELTRGGSVTGVDISSYFTERARKRVAPYPSARILQGEITRLELPRESFDLISIVHVIHDIPRARRSSTVRALGVLLKPNGRLWIWEPTRPSHGMPAGEVRGLMEEAGLREVAAQVEGNAFKGVFVK